MAEINLLKQNTGNFNFYQKIPNLFVSALFFILILLVVYYIWLFFSSKDVSKKIVETQQQMNLQKKQALTSPDREQLFTRQGQSQALESIISGHPYWSQLLPALAKVTLKAANYQSLNANSDGTVSLDVTVPSLADLDKFMQVFDIAKFNENFSDIRIGSYSKVQGKDASSIKFRLEMKYNPELIKYKPKT